MTERIGFVGLGIMGQGMAHNLLKAGFSLTVWNRTVSKAETLAEAGAQVAKTPAQVAAQSDIIVVCVSDTPDVKTVLFDAEGLFEAVQPGSLVIDCSTISPVATQEFASKLAEKETAMLDAPISGGSEGAVNGTLSIMVGGAIVDVERAMPVLEAMGKTITHVGDCGAGQTVKLVNQILVVNNMLGVAEALLFAQAGGVNLEKALQAVEAGAAGSWMLSNRAPQVLDRDWRPGFTIDLQQKDLRLVLEAADKFGTPIPSTSLIFQLYRTLQKQGLGEEGNHALVKALEHVAGFAINE